jgi:hypothetical protein
MKKMFIFLLLIFFISNASFAVTKALPRLAPGLLPLPPSSVVITPRGLSPIDAKKSGRLYSPFEFGISLGLLAGIPGASVEYKWNQPLEIDPFSLKAGVMYAQGKDPAGAERKNALVFLDGIYRFSSPVKRDNGVYLGGGLNYLAYTTGQVQGAVGGEIYIGIDSLIRKTESVYVELGYGLIRTGFSPDFNGWNAMIGYRTKI